MSGWEHHYYAVFAGYNRQLMQSAAWELSQNMRDMTASQVIQLREEFSQKTSLEWAVDWNKIKPPLRMGIDADALFFVLAVGTFHPNGYYRERCLICLEAYGGRALPFTLLLSNNWVPVVREKALELSLRLYAQATVRQVLDSLPYLERIRRGYRRTDQAWRQLYRAAQSRLEQNMQAIHAADILKEDAFTRRLCYRLLADSGMLDEQAAQEFLNRDQDAFNKIKLADCLLRSEPVSSGIMALLLNHKIGAVRLAALRVKARQAGGLWPGAEECLYDPCRSVREFAVYLYRTHSAGDPAVSYRKRLGESPSAGVIAGLGETGSREDAVMIEPFLVSDRPAMLRAAITATANLLGQDTVDILYDFLGHPHGGKAAFQALKRLKPHISCSRCFQDYQKAAVPILRQRLFHFICQGSNWDKLPWLIRLYDDLPEEMKGTAWRQLLYWQAGYIKPTFAQHKAVADALADAKKLPDTLRQSIEFSLRTASY